MPFESITEACQERLRAHLRSGDWALDATAGNGYDTVCLAECVGPTGRVWALDRQPRALDATRQRLLAAGCADQSRLMQGDHGRLRALLAPETKQRLRAIVFNLGYLPGGDKSLTTQTPSTLAALKAADELLAPGGLLAVVCYPGHAAGAEEARAVEAWASTQSNRDDRTLDIIRPSPKRRPPPFLLCLYAAE